MVDTGASVVALRERDANKLGIFPAARDYTARTSTANGVIKVAPVRLPSLEVNGIRVYDVQAVVIPDQALEHEPARHVVSVARAPLRDGQWPSRDGTVARLSLPSKAGNPVSHMRLTAAIVALLLGSPAFADDDTGVDLMLPKPKPSLTPNTYAYESEPMVKPTGFREYDARWLFEKEINLMGVQALGLGLGTLIHELGVKPELVTGARFPRLFGLDQDGAGHRPDDAPASR